MVARLVATPKATLPTMTLSSRTGSKPRTFWSYCSRRRQGRSLPLSIRLWTSLSCLLAEDPDDALASNRLVTSCRKSPSCRSVLVIAEGLGRSVCCCSPSLSALPACLCGHFWPSGRAGRGRRDGGQAVLRERGGGPVPAAGCGRGGAITMGGSLLVARRTAILVEL
jgi:hypothetical protein